VSDKNWISCPDAPVYVLCEPLDESVPPADRGEHRGLLWGKGDPLLAGLRSFVWAVAKVANYYEMESQYGGCVFFDTHEIVFEGKRQEAVRSLIDYGADPAEISVEVDIGAGLTVAKTGNWGTSVASSGGVAMSGDRGYAEAGFKGIARTNDAGYAEAASRGIAWADEGGEARADEGGVAIIDGDRYGSATASRRGIAIGLGRYNTVKAGEGGIAIAMSNGKVSVGDHGIAVSSRGDGEVYGGEHSIVVGRVVSGGLGSLLVSRRWIPETNTVHTAFDCVGQNQILPHVAYIAGADGILIRYDGKLDVMDLGGDHDEYIKFIAAQNLGGNSDE
jgi:hypothetical protein